MAEGVGRKEKTLRTVDCKMSPMTPSLARRHVNAASLRGTAKPGAGPACGRGRRGGEWAGPRGPEAAQGAEGGGQRGDVTA